MNARENFKKHIEMMPDSRLAMFVICCHVDKPLEEEMPASIYHVPIQAGAALTNKRVCEINDFDGEEDSISERNQRYSEMTAMYWIGKNLETDYVGISHYRRRFLLSDKQLKDYINQGFDIITTQPYPLPENVNDNYAASYYKYDWDLFREILQKRNPEYVEKANEIFEWDTIHPCNMNIFRKEIYREYCEFAFPILDEFYQRSSWKKDTYQRRDVGFIGERLSSLFVEKKKEEGLVVLEAPFRDLRSKGWEPENECDLSDFDAVYAACKNYYAADNITRCRNLTAGAMARGGYRDAKISELANLFHAAIQEQKQLPETMYEYLPIQWKQDLDTLFEAYRSIGIMVNLLKNNASEETINMFRDFLNATGFTEIAVRSQCKNLGVEEEEKILQYAPFRDPILVFGGNDICHGVLRDLAISLGKAYEQLGERVIFLEADDKERLQEIIRNTKDHISMVIGAQSLALNGAYFNNMKQVPKVQLIVDSPYFMGDFFENLNDSYYCFFQDFKYAEFVRDYKNCQNVYYLPPGGKNAQFVETNAMPKQAEKNNLTEDAKLTADSAQIKKYDISFVGSYHVPSNRREEWTSFEQNYHTYMLSHPSETYLEGLINFLDKQNMNYQKNELPGLLQKLSAVCYDINYQYRHRIMEKLLTAGLKIHVFGDTWQDFRGEGRENLIMHDEINHEEALEVYSQSKISLNIMSWHKAGITERVLNIMASGSVCVSDKTEALLEEFISDENSEGQQLVLFDMESLDGLPDVLRRLLEKDEERERICNNAVNIWRENHSWICRAYDIYSVVKARTE